MAQNSFGAPVALVSLIVAVALMVLPGESYDLPGCPVTAEQARNVKGGAMDAHLIAHMVASTTVGCTGLASHESDLDADETTTFCDGASYSGCGGGACGTYDQHDLSGIGNRGLTGTKVCSTENCGGMQVTCGSGDFDKCE